MKNVLAYLLILLGVLLLAWIGYDEFRGVTRVPSYFETEGTPDIIQKQSAPEQFHNAILCHSYYAFAFLTLGVLMRVVDKRMDKSDPMSPDFAGNQALDDWAEAMKEEEARRKEPKQ